MISDAPQYDAALEAVRRSVHSNTNKSFKQTFNSCLLIWTAGRQSSNGRHVANKARLVSLSALVGSLLVIVTNWHHLVLFIHHFFQP